MDVLIVNSEEVKAILDMKSAIGVMEKAFTLYNDGGLIPSRSAMHIEQNKVLGVMPSYLNGLAKAGVKVNTVFSGNSGSRYHIHQGAVLVFEDTRGCLEAIVDAAEVTNVRTAAASALATGLLADGRASVLAIIGAGTQGGLHLEAMLTVRDIKRVNVWDLYPNISHDFSQRASQKHNVEIKIASDVENAVKDADIICVSTPSKQPVLLGDWVSAGTHINSVGFSGPKGRELDNTLIKKSRLYVDCKESILHDCGDIIVPVSNGIINETNILGDLRDLLTLKSEGRTSADDITLYKSAGVSIQDLACANYIHEQARKRGMGTSVKICGHNIS